MKKLLILIFFCVLFLTFSNAQNRKRASTSTKSSTSSSSSRSAKTGKYVTKDYANKHPSTTVTEKPKGKAKK